MHLCRYIRRHVDARGNGHLIFFRSRRCISCACEEVGDFNQSLGSRYFVCVVNETASFASFACAVEGAR